MLYNNWCYISLLLLLQGLKTWFDTSTKIKKEVSYISFAPRLQKKFPKDFPSRLKQDIVTFFVILKNSKIQNLKNSILVISFIIPWFSWSIYMYVYISKHTHIKTYTHVHIHTHAYTHLYTHVYTYIWIYIYIYVYARVYKCVYACLVLYVY